MHDDQKSFLEKTDFTRRGFVVTTLAAGFAAAIQPISAETITAERRIARAAAKRP